MSTVRAVLLIWAILSLPVAVLAGKFLASVNRDAPLPPPPDGIDRRAREPE